MVVGQWYSSYWSFTHYFIYVLEFKCTLIHYLYMTLFYPDYNMHNIYVTGH